MKITNVHVGTLHQKVRFANWYENCKLIWKLQSNSHVSVYGSYVDICNFHMRDTAGLKTFSGKEFFGWIAAWMTKTQREQSLAKPSTIHILIQIPVRYRLVWATDIAGSYTVAGSYSFGILFFSFESMISQFPRLNGGFLWLSGSYILRSWQLFLILP